MFFLDVVQRVVGNVGQDCTTATSAVALTGRRGVGLTAQRLTTSSTSSTVVQSAVRGSVLWSAIPTVCCPRHAPMNTGRCAWKVVHFVADHNEYTCNYNNRNASQRFKQRTSFLYVFCFQTMTSVHLLTRAKTAVTVATLTVGMHAIAQRAGLDLTAR